MKNGISCPLGPRGGKAGALFQPERSNDWLGVTLAVILALMATLSSTWLQAADRRDGKADDTIAFFESGAIPELRLIISDDKQNALRERPRDYVRCSLRVDGKTVFQSVGVKLKGAAGSYRDFDDLPGLTLNLDKYKKGQRFHGMEKLHLNNCVQDPTLACEWLGAELFRASGYPCPRVSHARVWINDRDLGIYVLREGFDEPFLKRSFADPRGNLYDGGFVQDIDNELEMDAGEDPDDRMDLLGLAAACAHAEPAARWDAIAERLDMERFLTFMALERLCGHWDGYTLNANNYRLYFPPGGRGVFLPHGMDQILGDPHAGLYDQSWPLLAAAVMQNDAWRLRYREILTRLLPTFRSTDRWTSRLDALQQRLAPILEGIDPERANGHRDQIQELKQRLTQRAEALEEIIGQMPEPMEFNEEGVAELADWGAAPDGETARLEEVDEAGVASYRITRDKFGDHASSWRRRVLLPHGEYVMEARLKTESVIPIPDEQPRGAGVRQSGGGRTEGHAGTTADWQVVTTRIRIPEDRREVELILELRARYGTAWFDRSSLRLRRLIEQ